MPTPDTKKPLVPRFEVIINGSEMSPASQAYVGELTVDVNMTLPSMFSLVMSGAQSDQEEFQWIDNPKLFSVGSMVEVKMGYDDALESLIKGEITGLEPAFVSDGLPSLTVRGYDRRHRLQRGTKTRTFVRMKDSDIANKIATETRLKPDIKDSKVVHEYVFQANQTDMEFLVERARLIQYEVVVEDKTLHFRPVSNAESESVTLTKEHDLLEFYPRLTSVGQVTEVTVRGWNPKGKQTILGRAKKGDEQSRMGEKRSDTSEIPEKFGGTRMITEQPILTQEEADQLAKSHFQDLSLAMITGEGTCWGRTDLKPGKVVKIDGAGERFGGKYYLTAVTHRYMAQRGYYTSFEFRRNAS